MLKPKSNSKPIDYSKKENWIINDSDKTNKEYDLIFFCGTSIFETEKESGIGNNFDQMRKMGYMNYMVCGSQLSEGARVFCPIQRQVALKYALNKYQSHDEIYEDIGTKEPYIDIEAALDYYFANYNKDGKRPFVLAGHSQGGALLAVVLVRYFLLTEKRKYLKNMVAAYALGYSISKTMWNQIPNKEGLIHFATGEDDFNCLLSWNTEGDGEKSKSFLLPEKEYDCLLINPLNWKTDETYAGVDKNLGVMLKVDNKDGSFSYKISTNIKDLLDAQINLKRGSVICTTKKDYMKLPYSDNLWGGKSLHSYDGRGFYNNMKENLKLRLRKFKEAKTK